MEKGERVVDDSLREYCGKCGELKENCRHSKSTSEVKFIDKDTNETIMVWTIEHEMPKHDSENCCSPSEESE